MPLAAAAARFLACTDLMPSTLAVYTATLDRLLADLGAEVPVAAVSRAQLEAHLDSCYPNVGPATWNRQLITFGSFFTWCVDRDLIAVSPAARIRRSRTAERQAQAIPYAQLRALWRDPRTGYASGRFGRWPTPPPPAPTNSSASTSNTWTCQPPSPDPRQRQRFTLRQPVGLGDRRAHRPP